MRGRRPANAAGHGRAEESPLRALFQDPRRLLAILLLGTTGGLVLAFLYARGELAGSDAMAYWASIRLWLAGDDPFHPPDPFMPWVYMPWSMLLFAPWALLPWSVAWFVWRTVNILLFAWTVGWAYRRRPLATAVAVALLALPIAATFDTGNITLFLALAVWLAQFVGPRLGGMLWALAAALKWVPALLIVFVPARARLWGLGFLSVAVILALATFPQTLVQIEIAINFPRPLRVDYFLLAWAAVPWLWRHPRPLWWANRRHLWRLGAAARGRLGQLWRGWRGDTEAGARARRFVQQRVRGFFGVR